MKYIHELYTDYICKCTPALDMLEPPKYILSFPNMQQPQNLNGLDPTPSPKGGL